MKKQYVLGFLFNGSKDLYTLIRKNRPEWQKGRWNGVGGKVEKEEEDEWGPAAPKKAMIREFKEEAGVETGFHDWDYYAVMHGKDWVVHVYRCFNDKHFESTEAMTDEVLGLFSFAHLNDLNAISNLSWLIPLAINIDKGIKTPVVIEYDH